ncbi:MAG: winged helix-turn-helix transcriptional regulator [Candidatus Micrarchaeota archaeon]
MLDSSDLKIIHFMLKNSRITLSEIAKNLKISQPAIQKRIQRLKSKGVIVGSTILLNQSKIGWKRAFVAVNADHKYYHSVIDSIKKLSMVTAIYQTVGPFAIGVEVVGPAGVVNGVIDHIRKIKGVRDFCPISLTDRVF